MPNLGNETFIADTPRNCTGDLRAIPVTMPEAGTLDSITAAMGSTTTHSAGAAIYDSSGNLIAVSTERTDVPSEEDWVTFTGFGTVNLAASTEYIIAVGADWGTTGDVNVFLNAFEAGGLATSGFPAFTDISNPPDPATFGADGSRDFGIYLTYTAGGGTVTSEGTPAAGPATAAGTSERELPASGTLASQAAATAGTSERELPGSGTPAAQAAATAGTSERVLSCTGELESAASSVAGTATLQIRLLLTSAEGRELRDEDGAVVANLANIAFEWYDKDTDTEGDPDVSGTFSTNASGEATIQIPGSALTAGQFGLLVLEHPTDNTIRGIYRIPVS